MVNLRPHTSRTWRVVTSWRKFTVLFINSVIV